MDWKESNQKKTAKEKPNPLQFAWRGIQTAYIHERHIRIQFLSMVLVFLAAFLFKVTVTEWLFLILCVGGVLTAELLNTSIEAAVDLSTGGSYHELAKIAKDVAAGAVLIIVIISVAVGTIIFVPYLLNLIH